MLRPGYSGAECSGKPKGDLVHGDDLDLAAMDRCAVGDYRVINKDVLTIDQDVAGAGIRSVKACNYVIRNKDVCG